MDKIFGLTERALQMSEDRAVLLTNNVVNSSTPHYKAKDIDFNGILQGLKQDTNLSATNSRHLPASNQLGGAKVLYRIPHQMNLDGNTVDDEIERKNFLENSLRYQVGLTFVQNKSDQLMKALKGE